MTARGKAAASPFRKASGPPAKKPGWAALVSGLGGAAVTVMALAKTPAAQRPGRLAPDGPLHRQSCWAYFMDEALGGEEREGRRSSEGPATLLAARPRAPAGGTEPLVRVL